MALPVAAQHGVGEPGPSLDQLYVASLQGRQVASLEEQGPALVAAASLDIPVPPETGNYTLDRAGVADGLWSGRPSLFHLHAAALLLEGYGGPARQAGKVAGGALTALGVVVGVPAKIAGESLQAKHPIAGSIFKGIENGAGALALGGKGLGRVGLGDIRDAADRLLGARYGERVVPTDSQRAAALRGMLLGRLARVRPEGVIPDEAFVQLAAQYMDAYRRSRVSNRIGAMALTLGRAYIQLDRYGVEGNARLLTKMRRRGARLDQNTREINRALASRIREITGATL